MKKTRRQYTREFKLEALHLLETSGKSATQIERDLGIGNGNLYRWKRKLAADGKDDQPDQKWLSDITYIPTAEGWLYLAAILDLYTRRIVGWAMSDRMMSALTVKALNMAIQQRQPGAGLIHHSDQGSQYTDGTYQALLKSHGFKSA
jgi:transposase InsO family protein